MSDYDKYARLTDASIIIGVLTLMFHLVFEMPTIILLVAILVMIVLTGIGLYFKLRTRRDEQQPV